MISSTNRYNWYLKLTRAKNMKCRWIHDDQMIIENDLLQLLLWLYDLWLSFIWEFYKRLVFTKTRGNVYRDKFYDAVPQNAAVLLLQLCKSCPQPRLSVIYCLHFPAKMFHCSTLNLREIFDCRQDIIYLKVSEFISWQNSSKSSSPFLSSSISFLKASTSSSEGFKLKLWR